MTEETIEEKYSFLLSYVRESKIKHEKEINDLRSENYKLEVLFKNQERDYNIIVSKLQAQQGKMDAIKQALKFFRGE